MTVKRKPLFRVRRSGIHGRGAFALRRIRKGTRIAEYAGERISHREADRRYKNAGNGLAHTFVFEVDERTCIDAGQGGNSTRFINHSCDPNCESIDENGRIFIYAIRNIQPGVELTYDYLLTGPPPRSRVERARYTCFCGAPNCNGTMSKGESRS